MSTIDQEGYRNLIGDWTITKRALVRRINRVLAKQNQVLRKTRGGWSTVNLGEFYILNHYGNVVDHHVDIVWLGQELNVMHESETLAV
jgi:hypothetical protein